MKYLWNNIQARDWDVSMKNSVFVASACVISAVIGFVLWCVIRLWALDSIDWLMCFILYPILIAILWTFIYTDRHSFHN